MTPRHMPNQSTARDPNATYRFNMFALLNMYKYPLFLRHHAASPSGGAHNPCRPICPSSW